MHDSCMTPWLYNSRESSDSATGFYYEVLANGHFVPGESRGETGRYKQKPVWQEILKVTEQACLYYFDRVHLNFNLATQSAKANKVKAHMLQVLILDAS